MTDADLEIPPEIIAFREGAYARLRALMKTLVDEGFATLPAPADLVLVTVAMACARTAALALTPTALAGEDLAEIAVALTEDVNRNRETRRGLMDQGETLQ